MDNIEFPSGELEVFVKADDNDLLLLSKNGTVGMIPAGKIKGSGSPGSSTSHTASLTPPANPVEGAEWFSLKNGIKYTYINDQWIES